MPTDTLVLVEHDGLSKTRRTSISDNTPAESGYVPLLDANGRINNLLLENTLWTSKSLRWVKSPTDTEQNISDGSSGKGPLNETVSNKKDPQIKWVEGQPVLFGFKDGTTYGVRVDTSRNSDSLSWNFSHNNVVISDGSGKKGPNNETFTDNKDPQIKWVEGSPVLFGFNSSGKTVGVRTDTSRNSDSLSWNFSHNDVVIADGSGKKGPNGKTFTDNKDPQVRWVAGDPVLFGFNSSGQTVGVRVDTCRNADTAAGLEIASVTNSQANQIVRTDSNGYIQNNYIYLNGAAETSSSNLKYFLYQNNADNRIRKSTIDEVQKVLNLDYFSYTLNLSSLSASYTYPVKFPSKNTNVLITNNSGFSLRLDTKAGNGNSEKSPITMCIVNNNTAMCSRVANLITSSSVYVYLKGGTNYTVYSMDRDYNNRATVLTSSTTDGSTTYAINTSPSYIPVAQSFFVLTGSADIVSSTTESFIKTSHVAYKATAWGDDGVSSPRAYVGSSFRIARADHNHRYNVENDWLRYYGDGGHVKLYGNSRAIIFRTDGTTNGYSSTLGTSSAYMWMYGNDTKRIMYLTSAGDLYPVRCFNAAYADLAECFIPEDKSGIYDKWKNRIVEITDNEEVILAKNNSNRCIGVVSDTYGYILNGTQEDIDNGNKIPVAMSGTVYVEAENVKLGHIGEHVCSGDKGLAKVTDNRSISIGKIIGFKDNMYKILVSI